VTEDLPVMCNVAPLISNIVYFVLAPAVLGCAVSIDIIVSMWYKHGIYMWCVVCGICMSERQTTGHQPPEWTRTARAKTSQVRGSKETPPEGGGGGRSLVLKAKSWSLEAKRAGGAASRSCRCTQAPPGTH
jgi:hypothetical protein